MRFIQFRQSATSPLKYRLELSSEETDEVKDLLQKIIDKLDFIEKREDRNKNEKE